ncbi:MAG: TrkA family potassium uptake protein [Desulfohalobiaceae bacterium]|nr:TrkA family potassium uptake protein [Desulfohalobiaceae bacterium]
MKKRFAVIGMSSFGFYVVKALFQEGHEVLAVDTDQHKVQTADRYSDEALVLDATNKDTLAKLGLENADSVIVSTGARIHASVLICLYLSELGVKDIVVQCEDTDHEKILQKVGATRVVHPEREMGYKLARSLSSS